MKLLSARKETRENFHLRLFISLTFISLRKMRNYNVLLAKIMCSDWEFLSPISLRLATGNTFNCIFSTPEFWFFEKHVVICFLQVNKTLKGLVEKAVNPETDEIQMLSNSLNEFTYAFVDPLRSDSDTRHTFKSCLDLMVDKAIDEGQKKVIYTATWPARILKLLSWFFCFRFRTNRQASRTLQKSMFYF